jgi:predicted protein tyrosine phosphatase
VNGLGGGDDAKNQMKKLLFICSQNQLRTLTAERLYDGFPGYAVKSAGTEPGARIRVNQGHIDRAVCGRKRLEVSGGRY